MRKLRNNSLPPGKFSHLLNITHQLLPYHCQKSSSIVSTNYARHRVISIMCNFTKNYYIYTACSDPGVHFFRTSVDGSRKRSCPRGPHERYIMSPGFCVLCYGDDGPGSCAGSVVKGPYGVLREPATESHLHAIEYGFAQLSLASSSETGQSTTSGSALASVNITPLTCSITNKEPPNLQGSLGSFTSAEDLSV